ncbi:M10 family metallopeptidase C-terminal domain-containing protein [Pararhizobium sp. BT-229]|uniref:calcium-binding protein n=1 Tax=Pararhizobium sp. BT-229 TaxID=2986923 RepID=UPI0021F7F574|nr:calcium-binding protein [Pararhizobium sp. BT-229]MCV9967569.1 M10 family metallopeptidase C-terminal domain-containing protein [Pararhizobium sp. BT-229]
MATFTSFFPGGVTPDHYNPPLTGFDYMPFFEEVVRFDQATQVGTPTSTTINFNLSNGLKLKLVGTGFKFDGSGNPIGGTVTSMVVYLNNGSTKMQELTGLSISLETFYDAAEAYDQYGMARFLMRGNDTLKGSAGDQDMNGYGGNDTFIGGTGNDFVHGGEGKDTYDGNGGSFDSLNFDDAYYTPSAFQGIILDASLGTVTDPWGNDETFTQFEQFRGTQYRDIFKGSGVSEEFMGLGGRDAINGGGGSDSVLYHRDDRRGGFGSVTVNLETGLATDGFGKIDTLVSIENARTGLAADKLIGNSAANFLRAGLGNDVLAGGLGNDTLRGEAGKDAFLFHKALNASTNVDDIEDFSVTDDTIRLDNAVFTVLTTGALTSGAFRANTTGLAGDSSDRIIYETDTGELYYDSNGTGTGGGILFATIGTGLALTAADFLIV